VGLFANPALSYHPHNIAPGERRRPEAGRAFRPLPGSPALAGGLDLRKKFGMDIGPHDFLGTPLAGNLPLGAIGAPAL
jgi:hypothetical protein